jgi:hypothetical protein
VGKLGSKEGSSERKSISGVGLLKGQSGYLRAILIIIYLNNLNSYAYKKNLPYNV